MMRRIKNRVLAKLSTKYPFVARYLITSFKPFDQKETAWSSIQKPLSESRIAIVTTAGVHHKDQEPFDMNDPDGDPTFREIDITRPLSSLTITHDYYDHSDALKDINIVFPVESLKEFEREGIIGSLSRKHYGFMGHITGRHINTLINHTAYEVAERLVKEGVDLVLLTPG